MKIFFTFLITLTTFNAFGQTDYFVYFKNKPDSAQYLNNPTTMLTQKALDRRNKYNIALDISDVPIYQNYISQIENLGLTILAKSKWLNGVMVQITEEQNTQIQNLPFVLETETFVKNPQGNLQTVAQHATQSIDNTTFFTDYNYGQTSTQIEQISLNALHQLNYTGEGVTVGIIDAGFPGVNTVEGFSYIRNNNHIKGGYNFVDDNSNIYTRSSHGTIVLSTIGGFIENSFVGGAIDADFYLYISEKSEEEIPQEEIWWIMAAEEADRVGVDVVNTSLGYSTFDDDRYSYNYEDMDGETTFITRGANFLTSKGVILVNSAGNSGTGSWHYITAPSDGANVFTIGAADASGNPASFSSYGPSSDGRIKPDVSALGVNTACISPQGDITSANGTSLSSPVITGAMACLIQAYPNVQPAILRQKVRESADHYTNPTSQLGYGIPNFSNAYNELLAIDEKPKNTFEIYPNPTNSLLNIKSDQTVKEIRLYNSLGQIVFKKSNSKQIDITPLAIGKYVIEILWKNGQKSVSQILKK